MGSPSAVDFDIAVSFAGEDRDYVRQFVKLLDPGLTVFYDAEYQVETWGEDLVEFFTTLYQTRTRFVVIFVSRHYAEKVWTRVERRSALAGALTKNGAYVLPVMLDDTQLPGLLPTVGYVDARHIGLEGLAAMASTKVTAVSHDGEIESGQPPLRGVPSTQEEVRQLFTERNGAWEYRAWAGLLKQGLLELEIKYRDHTIGYARNSGNYVRDEDFFDFTGDRLSLIRHLVDGFERVLQPSAQEAAFGAPGQPGDPDRIAHLAKLYVQVYEDLLDWSHDLRSVSARNDHARAAIQILAHYADQPIEAMREFVDAMVSEMEQVEDRIANGETVRIEQTLIFTLDDRVTDEFVRESELAAKDFSSH